MQHQRMQGFRDWEISWAQGVSVGSFQSRSFFKDLGVIQCSGLRVQVRHTHASQPNTILLNGLQRQLLLV